MRTLNILSYLLYLILIPYVLMVPVIIGITGYSIINAETELPTYRLMKETVSFTEHPVPLYIALTVYLILFTANVYATFLFYKIIKLFKKTHIFHSDVILYLKQIGYIFSIGYIIKHILNSMVVINDFFWNKSSSYADLNSIIDSPINGLIIGLFFLILSKVFQIAKIQKEENITLKEENELII